MCQLLRDTDEVAAQKFRTVRSIESGMVIENSES